MSARLKPLALTQGDPDGIGPEIALMAWAQREARDVPAFAILADPEHLRALAARLNIPASLKVCGWDEACDVFADRLPVVPLHNPEGAVGTIESIDRAVAAVTSGAAAALVTNPIAKSVLYAAGFRHPGHTEYLAHLAAGPEGEPLPVMLLWSETLAVVPVTIHVPLSRVPGLLTTDLIVRTAEIVARDMRRRFGLTKPRLALAGLNPHAGEGGALGPEDEAVVAPAVERLRALGIAAVGPLPADTMFHTRARQAYDVAICMYHDQALIPIKTLAFDEGVNVTLGLPFIRTSPDHGTAFDIAGRGIALPDSLCAALRLARRMADRAETEQAA